MFELDEVTVTADVTEQQITPRVSGDHRGYERQMLRWAASQITHNIDRLWKRGKNTGIDSGFYPRYLERVRSATPTLTDSRSYIPPALSVTWMLTIRPLTAADRKPIESIITAHFTDGGSYDVPTNDEQDGTFVRVAERNGALLGVMALSTYTTPTQLREAMYLVDTLDPVPDVARYGHIHAGYVAPAHTGEGIGSRLLERVHAIGQRDDVGVDVFVADAWFHGGADSPARLLRTHDYEVVHTHLIAGHAGGSCPKCGESCVCEAALAVRPARTG
jgi:GNAT superfamily N-acetyltransferase